jgi:hypothetical protein
MARSPNDLRRARLATARTWDQLKDLVEAHDSGANSVKLPDGVWRKSGLRRGDARAEVRYNVR